MICFYNQSQILLQSPLGLLNPKPHLASTTTCA
nr:MAG TPA: hypothetical protein [Caudoviricetes sp.]